MATLGRGVRALGLRGNKRCAGRGGHQQPTVDVMPAHLAQSDMHCTAPHRTAPQLRCTCRVRLRAVKLLSRRCRHNHETTGMWPISLLLKSRSGPLATQQDRTS